MTGASRVRGSGKTTGSASRGYSHPQSAAAGPVAPRKSPRQSRSQATVEAILEASARIFDEEGGAGTTNRIAEVAGVSIGSLYQYFPDKAALLTALHERQVEEVATATLRVLEEDAGRLAPETVPRMIDELLSIHHTRPNLQRLLHAESPHLAYSELDSRAKQALAGFLCDWLQGLAPKRTEAEVGLAARAVMRMGEGLIHATLDAPGPAASLDAAGAEIARAITAYVESWAETSE